MSYKETIAHAEFVKLYAAGVVEVIIPDVVAAEKLIWARYGISNFLPLRLFYKGAILIVILLVFLAQLGAFPGVRQSVAFAGIGLLLLALILLGVPNLRWSRRHIVRRIVRDPNLYDCLAQDQAIWIARAEE